jgi:hypothetical protein
MYFDDTRLNAWKCDHAWDSNIVHGCDPQPSTLQQQACNVRVPYVAVHALSRNLGWALHSTNQEEAGVSYIVEFSLRF